MQVNVGDIVRVKNLTIDYVVAGWHYLQDEMLKYFFKQYMALTECYYVVPALCLEQGLKPKMSIVPSYAIIENKGNIGTELNNYLVKNALLGNFSYDKIMLYENKEQFLEYKNRIMPLFMNKYYTLLNIRQGDLCRIDSLNATFIGFDSDEIYSYFVKQYGYCNREPKMYFRTKSKVLKSFYTNTDFTYNPVNWLESCVKESDVFSYVDSRYLMENYHV